ncbi:type II secretion system F family protein [Nocardia sp. NPDC051030]|uniref:type II secretion system F family protein n=1 Tax=Nocardia sp. NPDC051030 TaxID=3155162 RepID=UPI003428C970
MYTLGAIGVVLAFFGGTWMIWSGWRDRRDPLRPTSTRRRRSTPRWTKLRLIAGTLVGVIAWVTTGWFLLLPAAIGFAIVLPRMTARRGADRVIARLDGLEEWLRRLSSLLNAGLGLEQAILATHKTIPHELEPEIRRLISRLGSNSPTRAALLELADSLDDATGDLVCSAVIMGADMRSSGLPKALKDFADTVAADVRDRRQVEVERRSPRMQARTVSIIFVSILVYMFTLTDYMDPYRRPDQQVILILLLALFAGLLAYIAHLTRPIKPPRFLAEAEPAHKWWKPGETPAAQAVTAPARSNGATSHRGGARA